MRWLFIKILESAENYLEAIQILSERNGKVKAVDIAKFLDYSRPSVSIALKQLKVNELIEITDKAEILLTDRGKEIAEEMYERHKILTNILIALGVSEDTAKTDACKIEHYLSKETYEKLKQHYLP